jgi:rSAM/selenodomain-associated transferase 1
MNNPEETESHSRSLILFARQPVAGQVKTRLEPALGIEGTLALYQRLLNKQITLVSQYLNANCQLWVEGDSAHEDFAEFKGLAFQQYGDDLGLRMSNALGNALGQHSNAILIGCDCPEYSHEYFDRAFLALEQGADVVLGPAMDGGYVLVGLRRAEQALFHGIEWGSDVVLKQTRERIKTLGLTCYELETLNDIDEPQDLVLLNGTTML